MEKKAGSLDIIWSISLSLLVWPVMIGLAGSVLYLILILLNGAFDQHYGVDGWIFLASFVAMVIKKALS